jgi:MFS superfamily sulfate permease-like transporter
LAILDRIRLTERPQVHRMGHIPGTTSWTPLSADVQAAPEPGVLVVLFATPLWFANAVHFREEVEHALAEAGPGTRVLVLDTVGMSDLDFTGARALAQVLDHCERAHISFGMARAGDHVRRSLERSGLLQRIGPDHMFPTVGAAVTALTGGRAPRASEN